MLGLIKFSENTVATSKVFKAKYVSFCKLFLLYVMFQIKSDTSHSNCREHLLYNHLEGNMAPKGVGPGAFRFLTFNYIKA